LCNLKLASASIVRFTLKLAKIGVVELKDRLQVSWPRLNLGPLQPHHRRSGKIVNNCMAWHGRGFIIVTSDSAVRWDRWLPGRCAGLGRNRQLRVSEITDEASALGRSR